MSFLSFDLGKTQEDIVKTIVMYCYLNVLYYSHVGHVCDDRCGLTAGKAVARRTIENPGIDCICLKKYYSTVSI